MSDSGAVSARQPKESGEMTELARRYAEALIGAAEKAGGVQAALDELAEIEQDVLAAYPKFAQRLASHVFRRPTRTGFSPSSLRIERRSRFFGSSVS